MSNNKEKITIGLVPKHELFREGVERLIIRDPAYRLISVGEKREDILRIGDEIRPDIFLMDTTIINDLERIRKVSSTSPHTKIILFINEEFEDGFILDALEAGVKGFLSYNISEELFFRSVNAVYHGECVFPPPIASLILRAYEDLKHKHKKASEAKGPPIGLLTKRECQVLELLAKGYCNHAIEKELRVSKATVKTHIGNILKKLQVGDRTNAVLKAISNGWVKVEKNCFISDSKLKTQ